MQVQNPSQSGQPNGIRAQLIRAGPDDREKSRGDGIGGIEGTKSEENGGKRDQGVLGVLTLCCILLRTRVTEI